MTGSTLHTAHCTLHTKHCMHTAPEPTPVPAHEPVLFILQTEHWTLNTTGLYCMLHIYHFTLHTAKSCLSWDSRSTRRNEHWSVGQGLQTRLVFLNPSVQYLSSAVRIPGQLLTPSWQAFRKFTSNSSHLIWEGRWSVSSSPLSSSVACPLVRQLRLHQVC